MTFEQNVRAVLDCHFSCVREELIDNAVKCIVDLKCEQKPTLYVAKAKAEDVEELIKIINRGGAIISPNHTTIEPIYAEVLDNIRDEIASCRTQDKGWDLNDKYLIAKAVEVIDRYREREG